jgi:hypothetical protein
MTQPKQPKAAQATRKPKTSNSQHRLAKSTDRYAVDYMDHAPIWPATIYCTGLFRTTQNGAAPEPLNLTYEAKVMGRPLRYTLRSPQPLNIVDQAVYFHLCQRIGSENYTLLPPDHPRYPAYRQALGATGLWADSGLLVIHIKLSDLAHGIGLTRTGTNAQSVMASLNRLAAVNMHRQRLDVQPQSDEPHQGQSQFLGFLCGDDDVRIVLHGESAYAAYKRTGVAWVNMREHRQLSSKPAKALHAWLSAWASPIEAKRVSLETLIPKVWGDYPASKDVLKDRRRTLRKALGEVAALPGWVCSHTADGKQVVVRKPLFIGTQISPEAKSLPAAETPTAAADTPTQVAMTATQPATTATVDLLEPAEIHDDSGLLFAL